MRVRIRRFGRLRAGASALARTTTNSISRWSSPELPSPRRRRGFTAALAMGGFTPCLQGELRLLGHLEPSPFETHGRFCSPFRSALHPAHTTAWLIWPRLTSRSVLPRRPFRREARSPRVRTQAFPARPPDL